MFFLWFLCMGEAGLVVTPLYGYICTFSIGPRCWPFLSNFLSPLLFSDLSSYNAPILAVVFLIFCNLLCSLSQSQIIVSSPFHPAILSTIQALVPTSLRSTIL